MTTLISFLGKQANGYRTARYCFDAGFTREVPFFGMALAEYVQPDKLILLGTASSMWDVLFLEETESKDDSLLHLVEAASAGRVDQPLLDQHAQRLEEKLGYPVRCQLIPFARDEAEQVAILSELSARVDQDERIVLDVTHAFRHLPMLALVAARYLQHVRRVDVQDIYYGALTMEDQHGNTPVLRLGGMLRMLNWVDALSSYEKDGDYGVFAKLLEDDGLERSRAALLEKAAFFERTNNPVKARETLSSVFPSVESHDGALGRLFRGELVKRISWFRGPSRDDWEQSLARAYLERRDYLRTATFMYEAFVTRATNAEKFNPNDFAQRDEAYKRARSEHPEVKQLEYLRNALAHGVRPRDDRDGRTLGDEISLRDKLSGLLKKLFSR